MKIAKNGHQVKAIAFVKSTLWVKNEKWKKKNMLKTSLQHIAVVLCKKRLEKTANARKMRPFWKLPKNGHLAKAIAFAKWSLWLKNEKCKKKKLKTFLQHTAVCSIKKKRLEKQLIFEKWNHFENCQKWPPSKGYSLCKIVTLAQKLKMQKIC